MGDLYLLPTVRNNVTRTLDLQTPNKYVRYCDSSGDHLTLKTQHLVRQLTRTEGVGPIQRKSNEEGLGMDSYLGVDIKIPYFCSVNVTDEIRVLPRVGDGSCSPGSP